MPQWLLPLISISAFGFAFILLHRYSNKHGWGYFSSKFPEGVGKVEITLSNCVISFGKWTHATIEKNVRIDISEKGISFSIPIVLLGGGKRCFTISKLDVIHSEYKKKLLSEKYELNFENGKRIVVYEKAAEKIRDCLESK